MPVAEQTTSYRAADLEIPCFLCTPAGKGPFPLVIVLHGSDGFKPNHAQVARQLARQGLAALAPTWFGGDSPRSHWDELHPADISAGLFWARSLPAVDTNRLGLIGFSRGGGLALIMGALMAQARAIVNYFGLTAWNGGLQEFPHLPLNAADPYDFVGRISCPVLSFHGAADTVVSAEDTRNLDAACRKYGVRHNYVIYPNVDHSFIWPGDSHRQHAHEDSWEKTIAFFKEHLL
jgi:carboxymethylenebutenolidase